MTNSSSTYTYIDSNRPTRRQQATRTSTNIQQPTREGEGGGRGLHEFGTPRI